MSKYLPSIPLSPEEKAFVIYRLALKDDVVAIKEDFFKMFDRPIEGSNIMKIRELCADKIAEESYNILNDIESEPLAHAKVRLRYANHVLGYALKERPIGVAIKVGEDEWLKPEYGINEMAAIAALKFAREEEQMAKKFLLEVKKLKLEEEKEEILKSGFDVITVNSGIDDDDEEEDEDA